MRKENDGFAALVQDPAVRAQIAERLDFTSPSVAPTTGMPGSAAAGILVRLYITLADDLDPTVRAVVRANPTVPANVRASVDALSRSFD